MAIEVTFQKKQREAYNTSLQTPVTFAGGAKGGGKSYLVRARETIRRLQYPNTRGLIVRKTYPELLANHIRPFFIEYPQVREWYNKAEKTIYYPNGSTTEFSYLRATDDVYTYQGREYEDISIDEVTQHEWEVVKILRSSNRTTNKDIKPSMLLTGNPGGVGHQDVKRIFVDRNFRKDEKPDDFAFVQMFVQDNDVLMDADPEYLDRLKDLPNHLMRAYLLGDWDIFSGLSFSELRRDIHIIKPKSLGDRATYFGGYDYGFNHPFAFVLFAVDEDGKVYVVGHIRKTNVQTPEQARLINNLIGDRHIKIYCGHDIWSIKGGHKIVDELKSNSPKNLWLQANIDRVQGVAQVRKQIRHGETPPNLYFFENTVDVYENVASMQYNEKKPEDVLKVNANEYGVGGDDLFDAFKYGLNSYFSPRQPEKQPIKTNTGAELMKFVKMNRRING